MSIILLLSLVALFISAFLLSISTTMAVNNRILVKSSLKKVNNYVNYSAVDEELSEPFFSRIIMPAVKMFTRIGRKLTPSGFLENIRHRLVLAGNSKSFDADRFLAYKGFCLIASVVIVIISLTFLGKSKNQIILGFIAIAVCFFLPDLWLNQKIAARKKAIRLALPDTLDLLTISVEAGLGFDAALQKVVRNTAGQLSEEFYRLLQEVQLGTARNEAFRNLGERTQVDELSSFILAMLQAEVFGISIGKVLRVQSRELRIKRRQRAEEMAQKAPVKIIFPLVTCIFPAILVVIMGPAVIQIYESILRSF